MACTAWMSMESNCLRHSWLRRTQLIVGSAPLFSRARKKRALLHQSPYLPIGKAKANEGMFADEEPSHTPFCSLYVLWRGNWCLSFLWGGWCVFFLCSCCWGWCLCFLCSCSLCFCLCCSLGRSLFFL